MRLDILTKRIAPTGVRCLRRRPAYFAPWPGAQRGGVPEQLVLFFQGSGSLPRPYQQTIFLGTDRRGAWFVHGDCTCVWGIIANTAAVLRVAA